MEKFNFYGEKNCIYQFNLFFDDLLLIFNNFIYGIYYLTLNFTRSR